MNSALMSGMTVPPVGLADREAQHPVVLCVHGFAFLCVAGVIGPVKCDPAQLKDDVPLRLSGAM